MNSKLTKVLLLVLGLLAMTFISQAAQPQLLGTPVKVSENRGRMAVDIDGKPFIAAFAYDHYKNGSRNSLLLVNPLNGETTQYWYPKKDAANGDLFHMLRANNGCLYLTLGNEFVEFNLNQRAWTFHAPIDGMAMSFTQAPDGKVYFGTYPKSTLWEFDPATRELREVGRLDDTEKYPSFLGADKFGWVYAGIGTARNNLVAMNAQTGERVQLADEATRNVGSGVVYLGQDGNIYGRAFGSSKSPLLLLQNGKATPVDAANVHFNVRNDIHFQSVLTDFPNGAKLLGVDLGSKRASFIDKDGKRHDVTFDYQTNGAMISSLTLGNDGNIYGSTNHPMHLWKYDPMKSTFTDYGGIPEVGGGNFPNLVAWNNKIVGATYPHGTAYIFDPSLPWTNGIGDNPNPKQIGDYTDDVLARPRVALLLNDGHTAIFSGFSGYGRTGGGMVFYDLQTNTAKVLSSEELLPGHSTIALRQLPNGLLAGGTSIEAPGGGHLLATKSVIYLMDPKTQKVLSQTEIGSDIYSLEVLSNGNVVGVTRDSHLFIFDPNTKKVLLNKDVKSSGGTLNAGQSLIRDKQGNVYLVLYSSISEVAPDGKITKLTDLPEGATSGTTILNGELYYASSSFLWKYALPK